MLCADTRCSSFLQIFIFVAEVIPGVAHDGFFVCGLQFAAELAGGTHPEGAGLDYRFFGDQGAGGDDRSGADPRPVQDDRSHADQATIFNYAAVQRDRVADRDVFAEIDAPLLLHAVEDAVVLHVGVGADADLVDVAADDGIHPDGGVFAQDHVADNLRGFVDKTGFGDGGADTFIGSNHSGAGN